MEEKRQTQFIVETIDPDQTATTSKWYSYIDLEARERLHALLGDTIGGFHSHAFEMERRNGGLVVIKAKVNLSKHDIKSMQEMYQSGIEIVVALNPTPRPTKPRLSEFLASGCFIDNDQAYRFSIGAYYLDLCANASHRARRARLFVPKRAWKNYF